MLLLITAMLGDGIELRPAPSAGCSIVADDRAPEPLPCEESADESAEDEESEAAKHAVLASAVALDWPAARGGKVRDVLSRLASGAHLDAAPIRGPPSRA